ncbi:MAG TPA: hypothetical protein VF664_12960 [Cystobacter sp.]
MPEQRTVGRAPKEREDKRSPSRKNELLRAEAPLFDSPAHVERSPKPVKRTQAGTKTAKGTQEPQGRRAASGGRTGQALAGPTKKAAAKKATAKTSRAAPARRSITSPRTKKK